MYSSKLLYCTVILCTCVVKKYEAFRFLLKKETYFWNFAGWAENILVMNFGCKKEIKNKAVNVRLRLNKLIGNNDVRKWKEKVRTLLLSATLAIVYLVVWIHMVRWKLVGYGTRIIIC